MSRTIKDLSEMVYEEYKQNGYEKMWTVEDQETQDFYDLAEAGLIHTEVSELQEWLRKGDLYESALECGDIVIRVMNFCTRTGVDLEAVIELKHSMNLERGERHGKKI